MRYCEGWTNEPSRRIGRECDSKARGPSNWVPWLPWATQGKGLGRDTRSLVWEALRESSGQLCLWVWAPRQRWGCTYSVRIISSFLGDHSIPLRPGPSPTHQARSLSSVSVRTSYTIQCKKQGESAINVLSYKIFFFLLWSLSCHKYLLFNVILRKENLSY